uniref:Uncharacterized protein n=1 Tax=Noccaea caerulescens TaxID=107243 RepID=A0A1J3IWW8_NOCCA
MIIGNNGIRLWLVDSSTGIEIGRTTKKFPLLTSREYVLAWKLWEGKDIFYCFTKECGTATEEVCACRLF